MPKFIYNEPSATEGMEITVAGKTQFRRGRNLGSFGFVTHGDTLEMTDDQAAGIIGDPRFLPVTKNESDNQPPSDNQKPQKPANAIK